MNAEPLLNIVAKALSEAKLEVIMIGNAAAALHGAPVTTLDIDFFFRKTPTNLKKLKAVADALDAVVLKPYYPASDLYRVVRDSDGMQLDFMSRIHGVRSFAALRSRSTKISFNGYDCWIASLEDIIKSKTSADRDQDRAVLRILKKTLSEKKKAKKSSK